MFTRTNPRQSQSPQNTISLRPRKLIPKEFVVGYIRHGAIMAPPSIFAKVPTYGMCEFLPRRRSHKLLFLLLPLLLSSRSPSSGRANPLRYFARSNTLRHTTKERTREGRRERRVKTTEKEDSAGASHTCRICRERQRLEGEE